MAGLPFGQVVAVGLHFPQAQKVAELGPLHPGRFLHSLGTCVFAQVFAGGGGYCLLI